jgi:serine/threonine protein kinase
MNRGEADTEFAEAAILGKIDPARKYFLYPHRMCNRTKPAGDDPDAEEIRKCVLQPRLGPYARMLIMEDGGKSLDKIDIGFVGSKLGPFILSLRNIMIGLQRLHDAGHVHFDIKLANIVTNDSLNTRIIDFGNMRPHTSFVKDDDLYGYEYTIWPFEVRFLDSVFNRANMKAAASDFNENVIDDFRMSSDVDVRFDSFPNWSAINELEALYMRLKSDPKTYVSKILVGADVYSLGHAMAQIYNRITGHVPRTGPRGQMELRVKDPSSTALMSIPADKQNPKLEELSKKWYYMTENMTKLSPFRRWTLKQSIDFFEAEIRPLIGDIRVGASRKRTKRIKKVRRTRRRNFPRVG